MNDDDPEFEARPKTAYAKLDDAIADLHALFASEDDDETGDVPIDAVLLIGSQYITDQGDRSGAVTICPRGGWRPAYITAAQLAQLKSGVALEYSATHQQGAPARFLLSLRRGVRTACARPPEAVLQ